MQTATNTPSRPLPGQASTTIVKADLRTRQLAEAMVRLNAEGTCTEAALLRDGFSAYELSHLGDAARAVADGIFVRRVEEPGVTPQPTDDELLAEALERARATVTPTELRRVLGKGLTHDRLARIWPRAVVKLASEIARLPIPAAAS